MIEFVRDLETFRFLQYAALAGLLASVPCGIVGSYVVARRSTYIAGAVSHCVLGGMGVARYLHKVHGIAWMTPTLGATLAAVLAAIILGIVTVTGRQRMDTALSTLWALGMAIGITFISLTPGYNEDLMSYLFGNILMVTPADLALMAVLGGIVSLVTAVFFNSFLAISFNEEQARLRGVRVDILETLFLVLTAVTIVLLIKVVGVVMVIALLTLPAATAGLFTKRLLPMMGAAVLLCAMFTFGGLALSYSPGLPAGATIIELAGAVYLAGCGVSWAKRRKRMR